MLFSININRLTNICSRTASGQALFNVSAAFLKTITEQEAILMNWLWDEQPVKLF